MRLVTATNRDLLEMVQAGTFRQDLYFRIAQVRIEMPPLRTRPTDIRAITRALLDHVAPGRAVTRKAKAQLLAYSWPGNVRQLRNVLQVAAAETPPGQPISAATIERHLPPVTDRAQDPVVLRATYEALGSIRATADALEVPYPTMRRRLIKHGIVVPKPVSTRS